MQTMMVDHRPAPLEFLSDYDDTPELPRPTQPYRVPSNQFGCLALGQTHYGQHYFLDGRAVYDGSALELFVAGTWRRGLFTWSADPCDAPRLALLAVTDAGCELIDLGVDVRCRWVSSHGDA